MNFRDTRDYEILYFQKKLIWHALTNPHLTMEERLQYAYIVRDNVFDFISTQMIRSMNDGLYKPMAVKDNLEALFKALQPLIDMYQDYSVSNNPNKNNSPTTIEAGKPYDIVMTDEGENNSAEIVNFNDYRVMFNHQLDCASSYENFSYWDNDKLYPMIMYGKFFIPIFDMSYKMAPISSESSILSVDEAFKRAQIISNFKSVKRLGALIVTDSLYNRESLATILNALDEKGIIVDDNVMVIRVPHQLIKLYYETDFDARTKSLTDIHYYIKSAFIRNMIHVLEDKNVGGVALTLYRVGDVNSPLVNAIARAAQQGKFIYCHIELDARGDEDTNIKVYQKLQESGCYVTCNYLGMKVHGKAFIAFPKEVDLKKLLMSKNDNELIDTIKEINTDKSYIALVSTGNFNWKTATKYADVITSFQDPVSSILSEKDTRIRKLLGYFACLYNSILEEDFYSEPLDAPMNLYFGKEIKKMLIRQIYDVSNGGNLGEINIICNNITDSDIIKALTTAAENGVKITIVCRTACLFSSKLPNVSIYCRIGLKLQHARLYHFRCLDKESAFISSADLMPRNLNERMEILCQINSTTYEQLIQNYLLSFDEDKSTLLYDLGGGKCVADKQGLFSNIVKK